MKFGDQMCHPASGQRWIEKETPLFLNQTVDNAVIYQPITLILLCKHCGLMSVLHLPTISVKAERL